MTFEELKLFLTEKMRMSHIYQPVMIKRLLSGKGSATDKEIAEMLLQFDPTQLEYYQEVTNKMVGKVLRSHKLVVKEGNTYSLPGFNRLSKLEVKELITICEEKLSTYINKRGDGIWKHRKVNRNTIPGTVRYEVLKRASFRCELCGIAADQRALEVDHIVPVNRRGNNEIENYQALCYVCNTNKRDRDDEDFRSLKEKYEFRQSKCLFCEVSSKRIISDNPLCFLMSDKYPVTPGHALIIPKRHTHDYFDLTQAEINSTRSLMRFATKYFQDKDESIQGFNIGINNGKVAGQTIFHTHIHLIPRRERDVDSPRGGVRNIIPGKGDYGEK